MKELEIFAALLISATSMDLVQDCAPFPQLQFAPLQEVDWMVGNWFDEGDKHTNVINSSSTKNRHAMVRPFPHQLAK